jgi:GNAT superfamily N-acetyltransferase
VDVSRLIREHVELRDGRVVTLRPIRADDAPALIELHHRLSPETQYLRFFGAKPTLSGDEAAYLASVDFVRRFAIVATVDEEGAERIVAVGRFDIDDDDHADVAIVVRDDHQRAGLGTAILERLVEVARGRGVKAFSGEILAENEKMLGLLRGAGLTIGRVEDAVVMVAAPIDELPLVLRALKIVAPYAGGLIDRAASIARRRPGQSS